MPGHRGDDLHSPEHEKDQCREVRTYGFLRNSLHTSNVVATARVLYLGDAHMASRAV
jgi:hypothetical protein